MIKTIIKAMYSAFISIVLISIVLAGWTSYAFITHSSKSAELISLIRDMYSSQKSVVVDVIDLSKILINGKSKSIAKDTNKLLVETESLTDLEDNPKLNESLITEDNGDNPMGIVIEPSLPEVPENTLPELREDQLVFEQNDFSLDEVEIEMDMNS